jgi:hypothetical protein
MEFGAHLRHTSGPQPVDRQWRARAKCKPILRVEIVGPTFMVVANVRPAWGEKNGGLVFETTTNMLVLNIRPPWLK